MDTKKIKEKIISQILNAPKIWLSLSIIFILVLAPFAAKIDSDYGVRAWFKQGDPLIQDLNLMERLFGNDERVVIALHNQNGIFNPHLIEKLSELTERMWQIHKIIRVDSLTNYNLAEAVDDDILIEPFIEVDRVNEPGYIEQRKKIATESKEMAGVFVSNDLKTAVIYATLAPTFGYNHRFKTIMDEVHALLKEYEDDKSFEIKLTGEATVNNAYQTVSMSDIRTMMPIMLIFITVLMYFLFRSIAGFVLPLVLVGTTIGTTLGIAKLCGFSFNNLMSAIPGIIMAICLADAIHILATYFRRKNLGLSAKEALKISLEKNLYPTFITSITTMVGFFSLAQSPLIPIQRLGFLAGVGTFLAWLFTVTFLCPLLIILDPKGRSTDSLETNEKYAFKVLDFFEKYRYIIVIVFTFLSVGAIWLGLQNKVNADPIAHFKESVKIQQDATFLTNTFNGLTGPKIIVDSGKEDGVKNPEFLKKVEALQEFIKLDPMVNQGVSILNTIKRLNKILHEDREEYFSIPDTSNAIGEILLLYSMSLPQGMEINNQVSIDNRYLKIAVQWSYRDSETSLAKIAEFEKKAKELGLNITTTGRLNMFHQMNKYIVSTFIRSIGMAIIIISILMVIILRSPSLGSLSLLPNVVPLFFGAGVMTLLSKPLDVGSSLVISVCLGIAVDDTIHFLVHFRDLRAEGKSVKESLVDIFVHTAPALIFTTIVLVCGFGVFLFADFLPNVNFGLLCSIIIGLALIVDLVFLPCILLVFSKCEKEEKALPGEQGLTS